MSEHISGIELSGRYYREIVRPILDKAFPGLEHSAALIGPGSEVLGFDTARSTDHHWGLRLILFLAEAEAGRLKARVDKVLRKYLPVSFLGYSTNFTPADPNDNGVRHPQPVEAGPVNHMVEITTSRAFFQRELGLDPWREFTPIDWLVFEEQRLLALTQGAVFHDGLGELESLRRKLAYYPRDVWLYLLSAEWCKVGQEEPFVGRTGEVGDEVGSRLVAARLVHTLMRLLFLYEKRYAPYSKWFGSAFNRLAGAVELQPALAAALAAATWGEREAHLCQAYEWMVRLHNQQRITPEVQERSTFFFGRPFRVIHGEAIGNLIWETIDDAAVRALPRGVGSVNQFLSSVDVLSNPQLCRRMKALYR